MNVPNPFTYGNPITDPSRFFGRRRELGLIFGRLRNPEFESSSIVGERRLGKTSLLYFASHPEVIRRFGLDPEVYLFVYLDLGIVGPDSTPTRLYKRMLSRIASRVEDPNLSEQIAAISQQDPIDSYDLTDVIEATTQKGLYIVLLMDAFEAVCGNPNFGTEFYSGLRSLAIHNNLAFVTASRRDLVEISPLDEVRSSPFFNIFATFDLPSFASVEIDELLSQTLTGTGVSFSQEDIERTIQLTGPHPHFLQMGFWSLFDSHQRHLDSAKRRDESVSTFLRQAEPILRAYWQISSQEEKIVLAVLALLEDSEREQEHPGLPEEIEQWYGQAINMLDLLVRRGLVKRTDDTHSLFSSAFSKWIVSGINGGRISFQSPEQLAKKNQRLLAGLPRGISLLIENLMSIGNMVNKTEGEESNIKVLLVYHHELTRQGMLVTLREHSDIEVVGDASNAAEATGLLDLASSDVILLDAEVPQVEGIHIIHFLRERAFPGAVIVVSADVQIGELVNAIRRAPEGGFVFAGSVMATAKGQETALRYMAELQSQPGQPSPQKTPRTLTLTQTRFSRRSRRSEHSPKAPKGHLLMKRARLVLR